jgi:3-dehydroquinate synthase
MEEVRVNLGERSYSIFIGLELMEKAGAIFQEQGIAGKILIVTNPTVAGWYLEPLQQSLTTAGYDVQAMEIPDGETYKSLEQVSRIYDRLVESKFDRKSVLIALGGGVIGDLAGFAAATYMRGVKFIQIPTTLLAQVDSSVGGKVAVNHPRGKNLIGSFYQPSLVLTDITTLKTLPERELRCGMAEVIKYGVILDENYFRLIMAELAMIRTVDPGTMSWVVAGSCEMKAQVVEQDEKESGLRAILNFGHTIGHALECVTNYTVFKHGEAVALGMLGAVQIALRMEILKQPDLYDLLLQFCRELDLPTQIPGLPVKDIYDAIYLDKKVAFGQIRWVIPQAIGNVEIYNDVPSQVVEQVLREMGADA